MGAHSADRELQEVIQDELEWTPEIDPADIGVAVEGRVVTLSGEVRSLWEKVAAAKAALRVRGTSAVINDLVVHAPSSRRWTETDVAKAVTQELATSINIPRTVKAELRDGVVRLIGTVRWEYERRAAERAVQHVRGVRHVENRLTLDERTAGVDVAERIRAALRRDAQLSGSPIQVTVDGHTVRLSGTVRSWAERMGAETLAWRAPNVAIVENDIQIRG